MMRSGFDIYFLDDKESSTKHCEFIATHRKQGIQVGVEAKSRRRQGVIHEPGKFLYSEDARGLEKLIREAKKQRPEGLPFLIFVDINKPPSPIETNIKDMPWLQDAKKALASLGIPTADTPDGFTAVILTNYSFHFGATDALVPRPEWVMVISKYPLVAIDPRLLSVIRNTLARYSSIPDEV
jgi:hypothetical protein